MLTIITSIVFIGFFLLYNTSQKVHFSSTWKIKIWAQANRQTSKVMGLLLLLIAMSLCILHFGVGAGIFSFLIILMTTAGLIVLVAPLGFVNYKALLLIFSLSFIVELI